MKSRVLKEIRRLLYCRRGVNEVISTVILAGAVIALGFVVLIYTQQTTLEQNNNYYDSTNNNIASIQEKLIFEYINYNRSLNELTAFIMNSGNSENIVISRVYLVNSSWTQEFDNIQLKYFNNTNASDLDINQEGFFRLTTNLQQNSSYTIKIVTNRGRYYVAILNT